MRYVFGFLCVCALGVLPVVGCTESPGEPCEPGNCPCQRPLDDYCKGSDCPSWEEAIAAAEKRAAQNSCDFSICLWPGGFDSGRCGDLRYVREDCHIVKILYFDASGTLVAAYIWTDNCGYVCPDSCSVDYGFRLECELEQEQDFCDQNE
jgi:hypothetical protein